MNEIQDRLKVLALNLSDVINDKVYPVSKKKLESGFIELQSIIEALNIKPTKTFNIVDGNLTASVAAERVAIESGVMVFYKDNEIAHIYPKITHMNIA